MLFYWFKHPLESNRFNSFGEYFTYANLKGVSYSEIPIEGCWIFDKNDKKCWSQPRFEPGVFQEAKNTQLTSFPLLLAKSIVIGWTKVNHLP